MDLYGSGASIAQANSQNELVRQANEVATDFNNSLAEQLDQAKTAENEEQTDVTSKNLASVVTSGGKLLTSASARDDVANAAKKIKAAPKAVVSKSPFKLGVESSEDIVRVQSSATLPEGAAERGQAILEGTGEGSEGLLKKVGFKSAEELGATGFAKTALAGVGGGIDIVKDIERGNFGSNPAQKIGNIGNIVGSGLEIAGIATAWTPFGLGLEGIGAAIALGSAALETGGDIAEGKEEAETTEKDIKSQARGQVATEQITQAVGRTQ